MSSKNSRSKSQRNKSLILFAVSLALSTSILYKADELLKDREDLLSISQISDAPTVSVSIGQYTFSLTGYTSPHAKVILEGQGMYEETTALDDGTFTFQAVFAPFTQREACLTAIDTNGRTSTPMCLPPFPINKHVSMGPIILPPTLSLNQDLYVRDDNAIGSGKSVPNSLISVQLATLDSETPIHVPAKSDTDGYFSLILPSKKVQAYEISAHTRNDILTSPSSTKLLYDVKPRWQLLFLYPLTYLRMFLPVLIPLIIATEAVLLFMYIRRKETQKSFDSDKLTSERSRT